MLENPTANKITVDIHKGMLFDVIDAMSHVQNMMVDRDYQIQLEPYKRKTIEIDCHYANPLFHAPSNTPVQVTPFVASASLS
jgi:hypothetical protein